MALKSKATAKNLYETDYDLWVCEVVKQLKERNFDALDLENLIDEVSDLSRRDRKKLNSLLKRLFEHLLKLKYWHSETQRNEAHWKREILNFRQLIKEELDDSPSLKPYLSQNLDRCYQDARKLAAVGSSLPLDIFPEFPITNLDQVLDEDWLP